MGSSQQISPTMGFNPLLFAMVVVVLGGLGSNIGAIVGGIIIGITQSLSVTYFTAAMSDIVVYLILFLALMFKPTGLFGGKLNG
jgi:branched-chain amino acid transport system permease protein